MDKDVSNEIMMNYIKEEIVNIIKKIMENDLAQVILYGSYARGDHNNDSDIDIALLLHCDRITAKKYNDALADIATQLAMEYFAVVNFVCLPFDEFMKKKHGIHIFEI